MPEHAEKDVRNRKKRKLDLDSILGMPIEKAAGRVELIRDLKRFGIKELGLAKNKSFEEIAVDHTQFYGIYASYKNRIASAIRVDGETWDHICYEDKIQWKEHLDKLKEKNLDVLPITWEAIGKNRCPITKSLLKETLTRISYVVIHENTHIHFKKKRMDLPLETDEAIADHVAYDGAMRYYASNHLARKHIREDNEQWIEFFQYINKYYSLLADAYKHNPERISRIFAQAQEDGLTLQQSIKRKLDNAYFLHQIEYARYNEQVSEALHDLHPKEYLTDIRLLRERLRRNKVPFPNS